MIVVVCCWWCVVIVVVVFVVVGGVGVARRFYSLAHGGARADFGAVAPLWESIGIFIQYGSS